MPPIADGQPDTWIAIIGALVVFLTGGGLFKLLDWWWGKRKESRKDAIAEWEAIVTGLKADRDSDRKLIHELRNDQQTLKNRLAVCEWDRDQIHQELAVYREALETAGIKIPPRPPASGRHLKPPPDPEAALD